MQKDAFNDIVPKIKDADCIVFASPMYFWTVSSRIKAFIERFCCIAEEDSNPPLGRYEKYPVKDCALFMTSADDFFWTFEQAVSYYQFTMVNYIGFQDRGPVAVFASEPTQSIGKNFIRHSRGRKNTAGKK